MTKEINAMQREFDRRVNRLDMDDDYAQRVEAQDFGYYRDEEHGPPCPWAKAVAIACCMWAIGVGAWIWWQS